MNLLLSTFAAKQSFWKRCSNVAFLFCIIHLKLDLLVKRQTVLSSSLGQTRNSRQQRNLRTKWTVKYARCKLVLPVSPFVWYVWLMRQYIVTDAWGASSWHLTVKVMYMIWAVLCSRWPWCRMNIQGLSQKDKKTYALLQSMQSVMDKARI